MNDNSNKKQKGKKNKGKEEAPDSQKNKAEEETVCSLLPQHSLAKEKKENSNKTENEADKEVENKEPISESEM